MRRFLSPITLLALLFMGLVSPAQAIIVLGGTDAAGLSDGSGRNLNPAPANLDNYIGPFGSFLGTPIAPQYFVTAYHVMQGGSGVPFTYNNGTATPTVYSASFVAHDNDLAIWKLDGSQTFSLWAPLYTGPADETGMSVVMIGRGTQRGTPINNPNNQPAGWTSGAGDALVSWGTGTVQTIASNLGQDFPGDYLQIPFTRTTDGNGNVTDPNQGIYSAGDSGGPTFVFNAADQRYELAGINSAVETVLEQDGKTVVQGAIYDARGWYYDPSTQITGPDPVPLSSYATSIASRMSFVESVIPEPGTLSLLAIGATLFLVGRRRPLPL